MEVKTYTLDVEDIGAENSKFPILRTGSDFLKDEQASGQFSGNRGPVYPSELHHEIVDHGRPEAVYSACTSIFKFEKDPAMPQDVGQAWEAQASAASHFSWLAHPILSIVSNQ